MELTILEANVEPEKWTALEKAFNASGSLPPSIMQSHLVQSSDDPSLWRSREALEGYRRSVDLVAYSCFDQQRRNQAYRFSMFVLMRNDPSAHYQLVEVEIRPNSFASEIISRL